MTIDKAIFKAEMEETRRSMQMASCFLILVGMGLCIILVFLLGMAVGGGIFGGV